MECYFFVGNILIREVLKVYSLLFIGDDKCLFIVIRMGIRYKLLFDMEIIK